MKFFFTIYLLFCYLLINATQSSDMTLISARTIGTDSSCGHTDNTEINRDTIYTQIHFRQGYSRLDTNFSDNNIRLRHLTSLLDSIASAPTVRLKSVSIKGSASPEGPSDLNRRLSERRALSAREYILSHTNLPDSIVTILPSDVDWEMLHTLVTDTDMPWRDEVLDIISHTPIWIFQGKRIVGGRKKQLQDLNGGRAWEYMSEHLFPTMRNAHYRIIYEWETVEPIPCENMPEANADSLSMATQSFTDTVDSPLSHASGTTYATDITPSAKSRPDFTILLKTNLLYDAALTPNIGVEIPMASICRLRRTGCMHAGTRPQSINIGASTEATCHSTLVWVDYIPTATVSPDTSSDSTDRWLSTISSLESARAYSPTNGTMLSASSTNILSPWHAVST